METVQLVDPLEEISQHRINSQKKSHNLDHCFFARRKCRKCCPINEKTGRPETTFFLVLAGIFFCLGIVPSILGSIILYDVIHEVETNMTIIGYAIDRMLCDDGSDTKPWRISIVGTFIAHSRMFTDQTYYVCGWYQDVAWDLAQKQYPKYSLMRIWYWDDYPRYIYDTNPHDNLVTLYFGAGSFLLCLLILFIKSIFVMCCGFDATCGIFCSCRCRDPYKQLQSNLGNRV